MIKLEAKKMGFSDEVKKASKGLEDLAQKGAEKINVVINNVQRQVNDREGSFGKIVDTIDNVAKDITGKITDFDKNIRDEGGYEAKAKEQIDKVVGETNKAYKSVKENITSKFTTNGEYDAKKTKEFIDVTVQKTFEISKNILYLFSDIVRDTFQRFHEGFYQIFPTLKEKMTKYQGVGIAKKRPLLRKELDASLDFYKEASTKLPNPLKVRIGILEDIKENAVKSMDNLKNLYSKKVYHGVRSGKMDWDLHIKKTNACEKYLK